MSPEDTSEMIKQTLGHGLQYSLGDEYVQSLFIYASNIGGIASRGCGVEFGHQILFGHELTRDLDVRIAPHEVRHHKVLRHVVDRAAIAAASQVVIVADSSKIGLIGLTTIMPLNDVKKLITDVGAPAEFVGELRRQGVDVIPDVAVMNRGPQN
jgi:hypothetical protein